MLVVPYSSPNWVEMNICTSCASLENKNKMYIVEVKRPSDCTILSGQAKHLIYCYAWQILKFKLLSFGEETAISILVIDSIQLHVDRQLHDFLWYSLTYIPALNYSLNGLKIWSVRIASLLANHFMQM